MNNIFGKCDGCQRQVTRLVPKTRFHAKTKEYADHNGERLCSRCFWVLWKKDRNLWGERFFIFSVQCALGEKYGLRCGICDKPFPFDPDGVLYHAYFEHELDLVESYTHDQIVLLGHIRERRQHE